MKNVIIIGAGGHAAEIRDYICHHNLARPDKVITVLGFIDDNENNYDHYDFAEPYLGTIKNHLVNQKVFYLMGIANLKYRRPIIEMFQEKGANFTSFIHPTAIISRTCEIGEGVVISHNASIGAKAKIGNFNMLNSRCTIGHDTQMGDFNFICPQVAITGHTKIGDENFLGTNSCTIPGVSIGNKNTIAAGMVINKTVTDNEVIVYRGKERLTIKYETIVEEKEIFVSR